MSDQEVQEKTKRTITEELEVAGSQLVSRIKALINQGNIRRIIIRNADDKVLLDMPLTVGAVGGGALFLLAGPQMILLGAVAAIAAVFTRVKVEIVRELKEGEVLEDHQNRVKIQVEDDNEPTQ
ncbi:MAG: hypothetical protein CUN56_04240 [Phototrophicales bacterium]|nr:MAG: hypothetical protein CUN56_04240 [Phototrophicales bacterium]RMG75680.1 MAG: DUF4342 domain-containing protein [Chloroflexota bacterium]